MKEKEMDRLFKQLQEMLNIKAQEMIELFEKKGYSTSEGNEKNTFNVYNDADNAEFELTFKESRLDAISTNENMHHVSATFRFNISSESIEFAEELKALVDTIEGFDNPVN